jgi:acyl carrier protein
MVPAGVAGEIHIGGNGLAIGYLNRPELTAGKFIPDPFRKEGRLYKTGDLGRLLKDGSIAFIGRKDDQVKIRGFRIELGEIENTIQQFEGITSSVVLAIEDEAGEKQLVSYIVSKDPVDLSALRNYLNAKLPDYMIPAFYMQIAQLPLTANGKIDKKMLPAPDAMEVKRSSTYLPAGNETEEKLVAIWSDVLGVEAENISIQDNFFALGGHSLKAIRIVLRIHEQFDVEVDMTDFFNEPTIEALATEIDNAIWLRQSSGNGLIADQTVV